MALYVIDSDAFIDYLNGMPAAIALVEELVGRGETLCICDVVVAEVYAGLYPESEATAVNLLDSAEFIEISRQSAQQAGKWRFEFARQGIRLATTDVLVAAAAAQVGATVISGNVRHYPMPEVPVLKLPR